MKKPAVEIASLPRTCNEALVLTMLAGEKQHGYQMALEIEERSGGYFRFNHGTLYPVLHKLEKGGLIRGTWKQERPKRKRKYYVITAKGRRHLATLESQFRTFIENFTKVMGMTTL
ncbi:helix-turn-helix transcriptional regulator [Candidatus Neomarinimicrobiota bacterium]